MTSPLSHAVNKAIIVDIAVYVSYIPRYIQECIQQRYYMLFCTPDINRLLTVHGNIIVKNYTGM